MTVIDAAKRSKVRDVALWYAESKKSASCAVVAVTSQRSLLLIRRRKLKLRENVKQLG